MISWLRFLPYIAIAVLAGLLWLQTSRLGVAHGERDNAIAARKQAEANFQVSTIINQENLKTLNEIKTEAARINGIAADAAVTNDMLRRQIKDIVRKNAAPSDDAVTPAYVCNSFTELRQQAGASGSACN